MKKTLILAVLLVLPAQAFAQRIDSLSTIASSLDSKSGIAAVVNDNVITMFDLEQRMRLAILSSGMPDSSDVRVHILPQILRSLIDEQLQVQEAKRLDLSVSKEEVDVALERISRDNRIPGDILDFVKAHGVSPQAMTAQIRNGLLWSKVVQREVRPRIEIGDDEVDAAIERVRANTGKEEFLVSEIFLPVDNPKDEEEVKQVAQRLVDQIKSGASFAAVARQFSQGADAGQGGDIGWIQEGQLSPELNRTLVNGAAGQISAPIRTANGFHILGVREKRTISLGGDPSKMTLNLVQAFRAYKKADKAAVMQSAARVRAGVKSCATLDKDLEAFDGWKSQKLGDMPLSQAPAGLVEKVRNVPTGGSSEPMETDKGVIIMFVCGRSDAAGVDRDLVMRSIGTEKLELQARRLLRDLRRAAYLDVRLGKGK